MRNSSARASSWVLRVGLLWCLGCGGGGAQDPPGVTGPTDDGEIDETPVSTSPGVVRLQNLTAHPILSAYLDIDAEEGERIVRVEVTAGGRTQISDGELPGGRQVEFDLVLLVPSNQGLRVRRKAQVIVDGDMQVTAELPQGTDAFSLAITVAPDEAG